jgi:hypothetical protein
MKAGRSVWRQSGSSERRSASLQALHKIDMLGIIVVYEGLKHRRARGSRSGAILFREQSISREK